MENHDLLGHCDAHWTECWCDVGTLFLTGLKEMNKVSWPNREMTNNYLARVFGFLLFLAAVFIVFDFVLQPIFDALPFRSVTWPIFIPKKTGTLSKRIRVLKTPLK